MRYLVIIQNDKSIRTDDLEEAKDFGYFSDAPAQIVDLERKRFQDCTSFIWYNLTEEEVKSIDDSI